MAEIKIEGHKELRRAIRQTKDKQLRRAMRKAHKEVASIVSDEAKNKASKRSGYYARNIRPKGSDSSASVTISKKVPYRFAQHWGKRNSPNSQSGDAAIWRAAKDEREEILATFKERVESDILRFISRRSKIL